MISSKTFSTFVDNEVYIVSATRTPIGSFRSKLSKFTAPQLGAIAVRSAVEKSSLRVDRKFFLGYYIIINWYVLAEIDEVQMGNVLQAGVGQDPARQASLGAKLPLSVPTTTVNKVCASGMKTIMLLSQAIQSGHINVAVGGGFESMSRVPFLVPRGDIPYGGLKMIDGIVFDGLTDVYSQIHMGNCGEQTAKKMNISRQEQDDYAIDSYKKSAEFSALMAKVEITPIEIAASKTTPASTMSEDEEFKRVNFDKFNKLPTVFQKENGTITAGNASTRKCIRGQIYFAY